ncbi:hypothetical protein A2291_02325 [candidate division WOR-1 bacterium RIFOXYB2_FULL_42_35]|uniref:Organic solvent tolerance-like N-terminal domain-containing protein n=1 Tax=candidate division WOR-1 bacterium RIFOXYC2_FULL_41_25 TaxID=1802586 RepID=A0A1F4TRH8_UNCSA|nr:MAG: hypothetical protein A2247_07250 [candidate division WOR-1 bacterium RIFOXYA2_FULL_41_14]OGC25399.1 MAG: hypothetical protein A2291_02325 [candidate division WOR-1 bacterium RIFOXYB2_FULL_42_35]OGC35199.1 MAG: hypothetical protein A2462_07560 [candidate division WOR-1 bacterium RIFOXYC2_FULL_41_25]
MLIVNYLIINLKKVNPRIVLASMFLLCFILPTIAQEIPVNVKAEKLHYVEETGQIVASGSVEVRFKETTIMADFLCMDSATNIVTAEGKVRVFAAEYKTSASYLCYDANDKTSTFSNFKGQASPAKISGQLFLTADQLKDFKSKMIGQAGTATTCDYSSPHYFIAADKVEYYPNDKVIGHSVTLYLAKMPVLWVPYMYYDLSKEKRRNWEFGHNKVEGYFIKSSWGYPYGILYLDAMSVKGTGYGVENPYTLLGLGAGTYYLYHLDEQDTGISDWVTRVQHRKKLDQWTDLELNHSYTSTYMIPSGRREQTGFGLNLGYKNQSQWNLKVNTLSDRQVATEKYGLQFDQYDKKITTNYYANYDFSTQAPNWIRASQRLYHRRPLWSDKVTLTTKVNYYNSVAAAGQPGDERVEPEIVLAGKEDWGSWSILSNWYYDLDKDTYTGDSSWQYLEKQPELSVTLNKYDLKLFNLQPSFSFGRYHEVKYVPLLVGNRDFTADRYSASLNATRSLNLILGTQADLRASVDQRLYSPGDQMYVYQESVALNTMLGGFFKNKINYQKSLTDGNSPFFFDAVGTKYHNISESLTLYYLNNVNWTTTGGFNWQTDKWFDVMSNLRIVPNNQLIWNLNTGWDIENRRYKDLVNGLSFSPYSFLMMSVATTSDLNVGGVKSGSAIYDLVFLEKQPNQLKVRFNQVYDSAARQFQIRDILLVKDLHCWELKYRYSAYRREFSVVFTLKAMPGEPFGFDPGRGFYYQGFDNEFNKYNQEQIIRRY